MTGAAGVSGTVWTVGAWFGTVTGAGLGTWAGASVGAGTEEGVKLPEEADEEAGAAADELEEEAGWEGSPWAFCAACNTLFWPDR